MTLPVVFLPRAIRQLREVARYLSGVADMEVADDYTSRIVARCLELGDLPGRGRPRPDLGRRLRSIPFKKRVTIVYRWRRQSVEIAAIYYGGRQPSGLQRR